MESPGRSSTHSRQESGGGGQMRMKLWFLTLTGAFAPCVSAWGGPVTYTYTGQVISTFIPVIFQVPTEVTIEAIGGGGGNSPAYSQDGTLNGITPGGAAPMFPPHSRFRTVSMRMNRSRFGSAVRAAHRNITSTKPYSFATKRPADGEL